MNRRHFIRKGSVLASSIGCGMLLPGWVQQDEPLRIGEEWRRSMAYRETDLRPREVVLQEARNNIERHRKGKMLLSIRHKGEILARQPVSIAMQEHYFDWGCSMFRARDSFPDEDAFRQYMQSMRSLFNATTAKCYWDEGWHQPVEKEEGVRILDRFLSELEIGYEYDMRVKGHPLVWTIPKGIPQWMKQYDHDQRMLIWKRHVKDLLRQGGNRIHNWDVVNEMLWEPAMKNIYKRDWPHIDPIDEIADYVAMALRWTREENPDPIRIINDYGLIKEFNNLFSVKDQRKRYVQLVEALRQRDELPHAIGVQSHVGRWYEPDEVMQAYDELALAGLPIHVTEYWARLQDAPFETESIPEEELKGMLRQYLCDFYTVAFGHPAVEHITYWGNPFVDREGNTTHMYEALYDQIRSKWTTNCDVQTHANGRVSLDAFYGDYTLIINDQNIMFSFTPQDNGILKEIIVG